ncbi:MAG TPA: hypothetical protein VNO18_04795, partial [Xanthobacteraceae bacterium]|nr:hypothetical protein [Xanthobacteraceae bacterium]
VERPPHPARKRAPTSPRKRGEVKAAAKCDGPASAVAAAPSKRHGKLVISMLRFFAPESGKPGPGNKSEPGRGKR